VVCPVPQGAEHDSESVNPAKTKLCPCFHNPFASKQTTVCSPAVRFLVPRKSQFSNFRKGQPLEKLCALQRRKGDRPAADVGEETFWRTFPAK